MVKNSAEIIRKIMYEEHSREEWMELKRCFDEFVANASDEEIQAIEDSGAGEALCMICSGLNLKNV